MTNVTMSDFSERHESAMRNWLAFDTHPTRWGGDWRQGVAATPLGFVKVTTRADYTALEFIWSRTKYSRRWDREWPPMIIARLAREFAADVAAGRYAGRRSTSS